MNRGCLQLTETALENYEKYEVPIIAAPQARALLAHLPLAAGQSLLDVACGTGIIAREAAYMVGTKGSITGLDLNDRMIEVARQLAPTRSTQLEWCQGDAQNLPFQDCRFDVVLCQQGLQYFPNKLAALSEMRRVLVPKGRVGLCVWCGIERSPLHHEAVKAMARYAGSQAARLLEVAFAYGNAEELGVSISKAGFTEVEIWEAVETVSISQPEIVVPALLASTPIQPVLAELDDQSHRALIKEILLALEPYRTEDGIAVPQGAHNALARKPGTS